MYSYFVSSSSKKKLKAIDSLFDSDFFKSLGSVGKFVSFQLYLFIKDLIFNILCGSFIIFSWFNATAATN